MTYNLRRCAVFLQRQNQTADALLQNQVPAAGHSSIHGEIPSGFLSLRFFFPPFFFVFFFFELPNNALPPAGVERQLLGGDGPAGPQCGAKRAEEKQQHEQLQRQPHLDCHSLSPPPLEPDTVTRLPQNVTFFLAAVQSHGALHHRETVAGPVPCNNMRVDDRFQEQVTHLHLHFLQAHDWGTR